MRTILKYIFLIIPYLGYSQPQIHFDSTIYNMGYLVEGFEYKKNIIFKNTGTAPLIFNSVSTGDGGTYVEYPKTPILPGQNGQIIFVVSTIGRIGPRSKNISIRTNDPSQTSITIRYHIIWPKTTIQIEKSTLDLGVLKFGIGDTAEFRIMNTGTSPLHLGFDYNGLVEPDVFFIKINQPDSLRNKTLKNYEFAPGEVAKVSIALRNNYGNVGKFDRKFPIIYNSIDTLILTVKLNYVGDPGSKIIYEGTSVFFYEQKQLKKIVSYDIEGTLSFERYFEGPYCIRRISPWEEAFFDKGRLRYKIRK